LEVLKRLYRIEGQCGIVGLAFTGSMTRLGHDVNHKDKFGMAACSIP